MKLVSWQTTPFAVPALLAAGFGLYLFLQQPVFEHAVERYDDRPLSLFNGTASRRVAIVQYATKGDWLSQQSLVNHKAYADLHGYPYYNFSTRMATEDIRPFRDGRLTGSLIFGYDKLAYILKVMIDGLEGNLFDWLFWCDSDTLIVEPSLMLEAFLPDSAIFRPNEVPYLIMASDFNGLNDGTMLLRVNWWSVSVLAQAIADPYQRHPGIIARYSDQRSLLRVVTEDPEVNSHVHHHPRNWLNRDLLPGEHSQNNSMQIHLLGKHKRWPAFLQVAAETMDQGWDEMRDLYKNGTWEATVSSRNAAIREEADAFWKQAAISRPPLVTWDLQDTKVQLALPYLWTLPAAVVGAVLGYWLRMCLQSRTEHHWTALSEKDTEEA